MITQHDTAMEAPASSAALDRAAIVTRVVERWPRLSAYAQRAGREDDPVVRDLAVDRAAELYLTRACAAGERAAIEAFEHEFFAEVRACHARIWPPGLGLDELEQRTREKLFVHGAISGFTGRGDLRRWLRVVATRLIVDHLRARRREVPLEDELLDGLIERGADTTLAKAQLRAAIRMALHEAFAALTDRQRLLLRSELRGTQLSAIATSYQVHLRSIQRWVREAHEAFLAEFRRALVERLRIAPTELSSMLAFAHSQLASGLRDLAHDAATLPPPR